MRITRHLALVGGLQYGLSGPLDCNVFAVNCPGGVVLIDAGAGTNTKQLILNLESDLGHNRVASLLITHCHIDHCGGAASVNEMTGCSVFVPEQSRSILEGADEDKSGLQAARDQGIYPPSLPFIPCRVDHAVADGEQIEAAGQLFMPLHVRGHSHDSFCYLTNVAGASWLFTGDSVFYGGLLGVINAHGSGMDGYRADLGKLRSLGVEGLFPGHGLFTLKEGQRHLDIAIEQSKRNFLARQIGQGDMIF